MAVSFLLDLDHVGLLQPEPVFLVYLVPGREEKPLRANSSFSSPPIYRGRETETSSLENQYPNKARTSL
jgi:hypothetical protein